MTFNTLNTGIAFTAIANLLLAFSPIVTSAEARPSTQRYSCPGLHDTVDRFGAIVMNTKNRRVYNRLVADRSYCEREKRLVRITVPTRDGGCRVFTCREPLRYNR